MEKEINQSLKIQRILSIIVLLIGILTLVFMIAIEDEFGALPLFLITTGILWFTINQSKIKKHTP